MVVHCLVYYNCMEHETTIIGNYKQNKTPNEWNEMYYKQFI